MHVSIGGVVARRQKSGSEALRPTGIRATAGAMCGTTIPRRIVAIDAAIRAL